MKFNDLLEVARTGATFVIPNDGTTEGDAMWGLSGFYAKAGKLEPQVERFVKEYLGDDFEYYLDEGTEFLPTHVWIVPVNIYDLVKTAWRDSEAGGDTSADAQSVLVKSIFATSATETIELDWNYLKSQ